MSVVVIMLLPLAAALLVCIPFGKRWLAGVTVVACAAELALVVRLALQVVAGHAPGELLDAAWSKWIAVDGLSALILVLIALVGTTAAIFSVGYMAQSNLQPKKLRLYHANYNLFIFSMLVIPVLAEPTAIWIVVELTTLCSALLVSFDNTRDALEAAWKYVVLSLMGAGVALFGFLVLFAAMHAGGGGTYTWAGLVAAAPRMPPVLMQTAFLLILIGLGTKVGLVPMHTWLPDAHSQAPSPVCALLSGIETTSILYVILRLFPVMQAVRGAHAETWALVLGLISVGTAAFLLLQVKDYKRLFAFSTVEHMGIILAAIGLGAPAADYGAMQQIVSHSVTKSFCFFAAGAALLATGTREIAAVRGLIRRSPLTGAALIFGGLAITGAPPLAVFLSEFTILKAGLAQGQYLATGLLAAFIVIAFFGVMAHLNRMVFGVSANAEAQQSHAVPHAAAAFRLPFSCRLAMILAALPVLVLGVYVPKPLHDLLTLAAAALTR
ncbi:MAG TPA: proton-conducting transporter membrane subunit [Steroidobacteraceae bacterium]|nr:proton-conducting transporter membrane subunit [Steroidobacteraceae bacterium]